MKKILILCFGVCALFSGAQEDHTWRIGITWGFQGNKANYTGGMENAHARFHQNSYGGGAFGIVARYDHNERWMWLTGINLNNHGYEFALSENYSLRTPKDRFSKLETGFTSFEIPAMVHYKFNPNCKNVRWLIGGGFVQTFTGKESITKNISQVADANSGTYNYLSSTSETKGGNYWLLRWAVAREKIYRNGGILNLAFVCNIGFSALSTSVVNYNIDNQNYTHTFNNYGNFAGFRLTYFFKPLQSWKHQAKKNHTSLESSK